MNNWKYVPAMKESRFVADTDTTMSQNNANNNQNGTTYPDKPRSRSNSVNGQEVQDGGIHMERTIGLLGAVGMILGAIIGSGIFISPKGVVVATQSVGLSLLMWTVGGVVSMFGALGLAELASLIPKSAGEYNYLRITYARWVGFLFAWTVGFLIGPSSQAVVAMTSATYMLAPLFNDVCGEPPVILVKLLAGAIILFLTATNTYSVRLSATIQIIFMIGKVTALCVIIMGGIVKIIQGNTKHLATGFEGSNVYAGEIVLGFYSAMWAYGGWATVTYMVEEIIHPKRNIPLAYYIALPLVTILYIFVNIAYFTVMSPTELIASPAVAISWADSVIPNVYWIMPLCVALSTFGTSNGDIFISGRLFYVVARENEMPGILSMIQRRRKTPMPAAVFSCIFALFYIMAGEVVSLLGFLGFANWTFVGLTQLCVIVLRFKMKNAPRSYKVPIIFPAVVFLFSAIIVILPMTVNPQIEFLYATLLMLSGLIFYIPIVVLNKRAGCMRHVTTFFQLLMDVCPTTETRFDEKNN